MMKKKFNVYTVMVDLENDTLEIKAVGGRWFYELEGLKMKISKGSVVAELSIGSQGEYDEFKGSYNQMLDMMNFIRSAKKGEVAQKPKRSLWSKFMGS